MRDLDSIIQRDLDIVNRMHHNVYCVAPDGSKSIVDTASTKKEAEFHAGIIREQRPWDQFVVLPSPAAISLGI